MANGTELLRVSNLKTYIHTPNGTIKAVDDVTLEINKGTTLGLIGESGCGKTTVAMSIINLIPHLYKVEGVFVQHVVSKGEIIDGEVWFKGTNLLKLTQEEIRRFRGKEIAMIFQNPIPAMNPLEVIGFQLGETVTAHEQMEAAKRRELVFDLLGKVELKDAKKRYSHNPHSFSGGEGQRIMIAMALITGPSLLIADEPTKSLDVIVQRQVLNLLREMKKKFNLAMLLITHDLAIIAEMSDFVAIMYTGKIVEYGDVVSIYKNPRHPYTQGLLGSIPRLSGTKELKGLLGQPPNPLVTVTGCKFHPRCPYAVEECRKIEPPLAEVTPGHQTACLRVNEIPPW